MHRDVLGVRLLWAWRRSVANGEGEQANAASVPANLYNVDAVAAFHRDTLTATESARRLHRPPDAWRLHAAQSA